MSDPLLERYLAVEDQVERACKAAGRTRTEVCLLAISKFHSSEDIARLAAAGQVDFGENYVQEATTKRAMLGRLAENISWHMTGHIQKRKAKDVAGEFALIHTLDSAELADELEKRLAQTGRQQNTLLEINLASEGQKAGIAPGDARKLAEHVIDKCPHLKLSGLMCLPPVFDAGEASRPWFSSLRELRDRLSSELHYPLPELSMGMSGDFAAAIAEGATIVRIGTSIFGPRPVKRP